MSARRRRRIGPWATPVLAAVELSLVWSGVLAWRVAVVVAVMVEACLWVAALTRVAAGVSRYRRARATGADVWDGVEHALAAVVPRRLAHFVVLEPRLWACLGRWMAHRHDQGSTPTFAYHRQLAPLLAGTAVVVVVEGAVVDAVVALAAPGSPWGWAVIGVHLYGLALLGAMHASFVTRPHELRAEHLVLRDGVFHKIVIPRRAVAGARVERRSNLGRSGLKRLGPGRTVMAHGDSTVTLCLDQAVPVLVDGSAPAEALGELAVTADDPAGFVAALSPSQTDAGGGIRSLNSFTAEGER